MNKCSVYLDLATYESQNYIFFISTMFLSVGGVFEKYAFRHKSFPGVRRSFRAKHG